MTFNQIFWALVFAAVPAIMAGTIIGLLFGSFGFGLMLGICVGIVSLDLLLTVREDD